MRPPETAAGVEPELRHGLPRRVRWNRSAWRLWLRLALLGPPTVLLAWALLHMSWLLVVAAGTAVDARIVSRSAEPSSYTVTVEYPRRDWRGAEYPSREVLALPPDRWGALLRGKSLPARRLGRGALQIVRVETDGQPLDADAMAASLAFGVGPLVVGALALMWGRFTKEWWLVAWGRPVQGFVRTRSQRGKRFTRYAVSYEYREMALPGASATLHGTASVPRGVYEASEPGQPLTVLHALWTPRWHVAYPFGRFRAKPRKGPGAGGPARPAEPIGSRRSQ